MSAPILNLSNAPFLNRRPVLRFVAALWLLGLVLVALNATSFMRNRSGSTDLRSQLRSLNTEIEAVGAQIVDLQATLEDLDPEKQNSRVLYLNERIVERTFPWGRLFDDLGEVLPRQVRLRNLNPTIEKPTSRRRSTQGSEQDLVGLAIQGIAKNDEALYALVDGLFAHPGFVSPELNHERRRDAGQVSFGLHVQYLPGVAPEPSAGPAAVDGVGGGL